MVDQCKLNDVYFLDSDLVCVNLSIFQIVKIKVGLKLFILERGKLADVELLKLVQIYEKIFPQMWAELYNGLNKFLGLAFKLHQFNSIAKIMVGD